MTCTERNLCLSEIVFMFVYWLSDYRPVYAPDISEPVPPFKSFADLLILCRNCSLMFVFSLVMHPSQIKLPYLYFIK